MNATLKKMMSNIPIWIRKAVNSRIFPFVSAAIACGCYYLGWDLVTMYFLALSVVLILVFCDDITPVISCFLFLCVMISKQNSPSVVVNSAAFYHKTSTIVQIGILAACIAVSLVYNLVRNIINKRMKIIPAFWGIVAVAAVLILNGIFSKGYAAKNMVYGLTLAGFWLVVFALVFAGIKSGTDSVKRACEYFSAFAVLLIVELAVEYITTDGLFDGGFHRGLLTWGWGIYNTMGAYLVICIPPVMYLASKHKYGYLYYILDILLLVASMLCGSRQAMVFAPVIFLACMLILLIRGKNRKINLIITAAVIALGIVMAGIFHKQLGETIKNLFANFVVDGKPNGSGRWRIWKEGIANFLRAPIFGIGFYTDFSYNANSGLSFIPDMCHNTIIELLSACGIVGLAAYLFHRVQTVISYCKNRNAERTYLALSILALLLVSLVDNHIFNIFPTMIYSTLIALLIKSEKETSATNKETVTESKEPTPPLDAETPDSVTESQNDQEETVIR